MKIVNNIPKGNVKAPHGAKLRVSSNGQTNFNEKFSNSEEFEIVFTPENKDENGKDLFLKNGISQEDTITVGVEAGKKNNKRFYDLNQILRDRSTAHWYYSVGGGLYRHIWAIEPNDYNFFQDADQITQITHTVGLKTKQYVYIPQKIFNEDNRFVNYTPTNVNIKSFTNLDSDDLGDGAYSDLLIRPYKPITIMRNLDNPLENIKLATNGNYFIETTVGTEPPVDHGILTFIYDYELSEGAVPGQTFMRMDSEGSFTFSGKTSKYDEETPNSSYSFNIHPNDVDWGGNSVVIETNGTMTVSAQNLNLGNNISLGSLRANTTQILMTNESDPVKSISATVITPDFIILKLPYVHDNLGEQTYPIKQWGIPSEKQYTSLNYSNENDAMKINTNSKTITIPNLNTSDNHTIILINNNLLPQED